MTTDPYYVSYPGQPLCMALLGTQHDGALCTSIKWKEEGGTLETWMHGNYDLDLYPASAQFPTDPAYQMLHRTARQ